MSGLVEMVREVEAKGEVKIRAQASDKHLSGLDEIVTTLEDASTVFNSCSFIQF